MLVADPGRSTDHRSVDVAHHAAAPRGMSEGPGRGSPVEAWLSSVHERHQGNDDGAVATYIPELATADPRWFGIAVATIDGAAHAVGDADQPFTIQSISKVLTYGLVLERLGEAAVRRRIGVEPTGDAFNAITLDPATGRPLNPMVNAGAIAAAALFATTSGDDPWADLLDGFGRFAGRALAIDDRIHRSELQTGHRNRAIGQLLRSTGAIDSDPDAAVELYLRQCSIAVTTLDLARIAATLANGGTNPATGERILSPETTRSVLSVMTTCGMYDGAGDWLHAVGLPAKSGVAGGLIALLPGRLGIAVFSPPLDGHGNSVRAVAVCRQVSRDLDLHLVAGGAAGAGPIRARYAIADVGSKRRRGAAERQVLARRGGDAIVVELQGSLDLLAVERIAASLAGNPPDHVVLDLRRVSALEPSGVPLIAFLVAELRRSGAEVLASGGDRLVVGRQRIADALAGMGEPPLDHVAELDVALERVEELLLDGSGTDPAGAASLADHALLRGVGPAQLERVAASVEIRWWPAGERVVRRGDPARDLFLVLNGRLSVSIEVDGGERRRLSTLGPGMMFGEGALFGAGVRTADVDADDAVSCAVLSIVALEDLIAADPLIGATIFRNLADIVSETARRLTRELAVLAG